MKPRLLLADDDRRLCALLANNFERDGFDVISTPDGLEALRLAKDGRPDVVLLDWMIEGISGIEVCRHLRRSDETANVSIIMITGRDEGAGRIQGLGAGADDYVTKPFSPRELIARVEAVLRRSRPALGGGQLAFGDLIMDISSHRVRRGGRNISIDATEFRLLRQFMEHPGRVFSRERLLDLVWGHDKKIEARTVDSYIRKLRQALSHDGLPELIRTVRSAGYSLDDDAA